MSLSLLKHLREARGKGREDLLLASQDTSVLVKGLLLGNPVGKVLDKELLRLATLQDVIRTRPKTEISKFKSDVKRLQFVTELLQESDLALEVEEARCEAAAREHVEPLPNFGEPPSPIPIIQQQRTPEDTHPSPPADTDFLPVITEVTLRPRECISVDLSTGREGGDNSRVPQLRWILNTGGECKLRMWSTNNNNRFVQFITDDESIHALGPSSPLGPRPPSLAPSRLSSPVYSPRTSDNGHGHRDPRLAPGYDRGQGDFQPVLPAQRVNAFEEVTLAPGQSHTFILTPHDRRGVVMQAASIGEGQVPPQPSYQTNNDNDPVTMDQPRMASHSPHSRHSSVQAESVHGGHSPQLMGHPSRRLERSSPQSDYGRLPAAHSPSRQEHTSYYAAREHYSNVNAASESGSSPQESYGSGRGHRSRSISQSHVAYDGAGPVDFHPPRQPAAQSALGILPGASQLYGGVNDGMAYHHAPTMTHYLARHPSEDAYASPRPMHPVSATTLAQTVQPPASSDRPRSSVPLSPISTYFRTFPRGATSSSGTAGNMLLDHAGYLSSDMAFAPPSEATSTRPLQERRAVHRASYSDGMSMMARSTQPPALSSTLAQYSQAMYAPPAQASSEWTGRSEHMHSASPVYAPDPRSSLRSAHRPEQSWSDPDSGFSPSINEARVDPYPFRMPVASIRIPQAFTPSPAVSEAERTEFLPTPRSQQAQQHVANFTDPPRAPRLSPSPLPPHDPGLSPTERDWHAAHPAGPVEGGSDSELSISTSSTDFPPRADARLLDPHQGCRVPPRYEGDNDSLVRMTQRPEQH